MCGTGIMNAAQVAGEQHTGITQAVRMKHIQYECGTGSMRAAQAAGEQHAGCRGIGVVVW